MFVINAFFATSLTDKYQKQGKLYSHIQMKELV